MKCKSCVKCVKYLSNVYSKFSKSMWYGKSVFVVCWVKWKMWNNFFYENVDSDVGVFD